MMEHGQHEKCALHSTDCLKKKDSLEQNQCHIIQSKPIGPNIPVLSPWRLSNSSSLFTPHSQAYILPFKGQSPYQSYYWISSQALQNIRSLQPTLFLFMPKLFFPVTLNLCLRVTHSPASGNSFSVHFNKIPQINISVTCPCNLVCSM